MKEVDGTDGNIPDLAVFGRNILHGRLQTTDGIRTKLAPREGVLQSRRLAFVRNRLLADPGSYPGNAPQSHRHRSLETDVPTFNELIDVPRLLARSFARRAEYLLNTSAPDLAPFRARDLKCKRFR
jgi:hypothetical protein